jgi:hypothetical protein
MPRYISLYLWAEATDLAGPTRARRQTDRVRRPVRAEPLCEQDSDTTSLDR